MTLATHEQYAVLQAEQAVLGSVFRNNDVMNEIGTMLEPRDFVNATHELIWKGMQYQYKNDRPVDLVTMTNLMNEYKRLAEIGGVTYLSELASSVPSTANVKYYARIVYNNGLKKRGFEAAQSIIGLCTEMIENHEDFYSSVDKIINSLRPNSIGGMKKLGETKQDYFENLMKQNELIKFGFPKFDDWAGGVGRGWLYILAGRPSVGKTAKVLQTAVNIARQNVGEVLIWSQEMNRDQLINRMISQPSKVNATRIRRKTLEDDEVQTLNVTYDELASLPLHIDDASGVTIDQIKATARLIKRKHGRIAAIVVDYLTIMKIPQVKGQTRSQSVGEVTKQAKWLAKELDCVFIMLAQLNREGVQDEPQMHHLRDSGEIEQDADVVEFLWHKEDETTSQGKIIQSYIAKGRDMGTNRFKYLFKGWMQSYEDYE
jgi:replicative DNA helicase